VIHLNLYLEGDSVWPELKTLMEQGQILRVREMSIAALSGGMVSGKPSVAFRLDLEDGRIAVAETSLALLLTAADVLKARYGGTHE